MAQQTGTYFGKLIEVGLDKNANGTPFLYMTFQIAHFYDNGWVELPQPLVRDVRFYLSDAAWPYTAQDLEKYDFNGDWQNPGFREDLSDPGVEIICTSRKGEDNKVYNDWDLPDRSFGSGKERTPPTRDEVRTFQARWDTQKNANRKPPGSPGAPPPPNTSLPPRQATQPNPSPQYGAPDAGDDIPF